VDKIAIFVEGQGELIFVRTLLPLLIPYRMLSFQCLSISADTMSRVPYEYPNPDASFSFTVVNVGNDERVLTEVAEREEGLVNKGYCRIIAVRDMYCAEYHKRANNIDPTVNDQFVEQHEATISNRMTHSDLISIFFAIMELEAWLLGMYNLFKKVDPTLTCEYIEAKLGFNLHDIDPQTEFFHPANQIDKILSLVGEKYTKSRDQMESILSHLSSDDIENAIERSRCQSLALFLDELKSCTVDK
jgi:hypothetical protein